VIEIPAGRWSEAYDPVTGLATLPALLDHTQRSLMRVARQPQTIAIVATELDKLCDKSFSAEQQVALLQDVAERLQSVTRAGDLVGRIGDCGFALLFEDLGSFDEAIAITKRVLHLLDQPFVVGDRIVSVDAQLGVAFPLAEDRADDLLRRSLEAMHAARANPGQRYDMIVGSSDPPRQLFQ